MHIKNSLLLKRINSVIEKLCFFQRQRAIFAMDGIQTPFTYIGAPLSSFAWHIEDGNLCSINFLHTGSAPKFWWVQLWQFITSYITIEFIQKFRYIIHKNDSSKFEDLVRRILGKKKLCDFYIRHKTLMIPPSVLKKNGIKFTRVKLFNSKFCSIVYF